jgi:HK97 family phage prohead protease
VSVIAHRSIALDDHPLEVSRSGDGRTIHGYVAVFNQEAPVADVFGRYRETNAPAAFNKTVAERGRKFLVTYNHGMTLYGTPSSEFSVPLGVPTDVTIDSLGVRAAIRVDPTPLGDAIIEGARSGSIAGMSYTGTFLKSTTEMPRGGYRAARSGELPLVTRLEVAMREFGPTPIPTFDAAAIVGVRALVQSIEGLSPAERAELIALLSDATDLAESTRSETEPDAAGTPSGAAPSDEPPTEALRSDHHIAPAERIARIRRRLSGASRPDKEN